MWYSKSHSTEFLEHYWRIVGSLWITVLHKAFSTRDIYKEIPIAVTASFEQSSHNSHNINNIIFHIIPDYLYVQFHISPIPT